jgi:GNAT acetyltransferase-like protein
MEGVDVAFLPDDFVVPTLVAGLRFRIRPITVHDVVKAYDAVMSSRELLWERFGEVAEWPPADLTLEQLLVDLAWHQKQAQLRRSFGFAVLTTDETRLLGTVRIDPPTKAGADAETTFWVRRDAVGSGLEDELEEFVREWMTTTWPFKTVRYPGRDISWSDWNELPSAVRD